MLARFTVTQEDIDKASASFNAHRPSHCVLAKTMQRELAPNHVVVGLWNAFVKDVDGRTLATIPLSEDAASVRRDFDGQRTVHPTSFTCEIPDTLAKYFDRRIEMKPQRSGALVTA